MPKPGMKKAAAAPAKKMAVAPKAAKGKEAKGKAVKGEKKAAKVEKDPVQVKIEELEAAIAEHVMLDISVKNLLSSGLQHSLVDTVEDRHEFQHGMVEFVGKALDDAATRLKQNTADFKNITDTADEVRSSIEAEIAQTEAQITAKDTVKDTLRGEYERDEEAFIDAEAALVAHKDSLDTTVKTIGSKTAAVTDVTEKKESVFKPVLENPPESGKEGKRAVEQVKQLLKKVGAADSMLNAVGPALMTTDRQMFDQMILDQCSKLLDTFVQKTNAEVAELEASKTTIEGKIEEATAAVEAAKATMDVSDGNVKAVTDEISQLKQMKKSKTKSLSDHEKKVESAEVDRQEAFIVEAQFTMVLDTFKELQNRSATVPTDTNEDAKDVEMEDAVSAPEGAADGTVEEDEEQVEYSPEEAEEPEVGGYEGVHAAEEPGSKEEAPAAEAPAEAIPAAVEEEMAVEDAPMEAAAAEEVQEPVDAAAPAEEAYAAPEGQEYIQGANFGWY
mmetsp:Transcript_16688/g.41287  ORF Transcript_16688/g.41287 Transcript_16688/m.41287 type:complete len:502 (-) Transcript_16688:1497-3002(-)|eukprot:CAMPEP_0178985900 /NCGR_PEP_ID=MMETSP0795-20121207/2408_1 /TAXON_ID=88552 /ORGANISM="Amoebophrya sp., Strain Ameob2" /LENGTH=501 /DNA_ID=CAMNT_0020676907 /DNA_START=139 /DNA_END=1644 /DNA_ORIENTATION=+